MENCNSNQAGGHLRDARGPFYESPDLSHRKLRDIINIGITLSQTANISHIFTKIMDTGKEFTQADEGTFYQMVEHQGKEKLKFILSGLTIDDSLSLMEITPQRISGFVAISQKPLILEDAYNIPESAPYSFNKDYDRRSNYESHSMLLVPMLGHNGKTLGVIQLINKKRNGRDQLREPSDFRDKVIPFDQNDMEFIQALAGMGVIVLENRNLLDSIRQLLNDFVKASVSAIEQRDPTTSGHSERVAHYVLKLADAINQMTEGDYKDICFTDAQLRELHYASLLHDFGKVGVREKVLGKERKLAPEAMESVKGRLERLRSCLLLAKEKRLNQYLLTQGKENYKEFEKQLDDSYASDLKKLKQLTVKILKLDEPMVVAGNFEEDMGFVQEASQAFKDKYGFELLNSEEIELLQIQKGCLSEEERAQIESHAYYSYKFLKQIPWTKDLRELPEIAYDHHEQLDGSGYPNGKKASQISLLSQMICIADIYDALTAADRPYKRAIPSGQALDILGRMADEGKIDKQLLGAFKEKRCYLI